ncbi:hypothetical protein [Halalkalibacterium halodurans]|uniref:hypothetical protein n=1 Tax=Halalkalibacterium halodurans TaxID=86665 RepID=UPI002AAA12C9|nr:hypothetical protein [Halalkalibacterium halodurans]MDY7221183.1 hypothetical protein [Halalkalibacterium halodurans]MDY7240422.1 hypothetical protein [Halalkalibacterium halodurans]
MTKHVDEIVKDLVNGDLHKYWPGFESVAYALYDKQNVYLFNHPRMTNNKPNNYQVLKWNEQFNGCTLILYDDCPTAIVDLELYDDYASLYSILIHELFHGFQYIKGEKRFADEIMGITYPLLKENIELRNQERAHLFSAMLEKNVSKKKQHLTIFIALRDKRAAIINEHLLYENFIETIEGPALYVELKAFSEKSPISYKSALKTYGQPLLDKYFSTTNIRRSCYSSGLVMCLLLDEFSPGWKESFWNKEESLYDLLKQLSDDMVKINALEITPETKEVINFAKQNKKNEFENFEQQKGIHLIIEGEMIVKSFDPMNVVSFEKRLLHKSFIKVSINNENYLVRQPAIAHCKSGLRNIQKLHIILNSEPIERKDSIIIDGIGVLKGRYKKKENVMHLYVD